MAHPFSIATLQRPRHLALCAVLLTSAEVAFALTPRISLTPEQLAMAARRHQLPRVAQLECTALDTRLPHLTQTARRAKPPDKTTATQALQDARQRFQLLGC